MPGLGDDGTKALDGRSFTGSKLTGHDVGDVTKVRIAFKGVGFSGSGGCNTLSGPYAITAGVMSVGSIATTEMACAEPLMAQDTWFGAFLDGATVTIGDTLTLTKDGVTLVMTDAAAGNPTTTPIAGTTWILRSIGTGETVSSVPGTVTASLKITGADVQVAFGCNSGGGTATVSDTAITFGPLMSTMMACGSPKDDVERAMAGVLQGEVPFTIGGTTLTLKGANGTTLTFTPGAAG